MARRGIAVSVYVYETTASTSPLVFRFCLGTTGARRPRWHSRPVAADASLCSGD